MSTYIISDTHFFHTKLIDFLRTDYASLEDMHEDIIDKWTSIIRPEDKVYHLGDFAFGTDFDSIENLVKKLPGKITLIAGNHDTPAKLKIYEKYWRVASFIVEGEFVLSHMPIHPYLLEEVTVRSSGEPNRYNIHGHMHNGSLDDKRYFNANWDVLGSNKILLLDDIKQIVREGSNENL